MAITYECLDGYLQELEPEVRLVRVLVPGVKVMHEATCVAVFCVALDDGIHGPLGVRVLALPTLALGLAVQEEDDDASDDRGEDGRIDVP